MFKNNHLLRMFSMLALLAFGCGERLMAEEPAPEKEKIHIVDLPPDTKVKLWTETSNKDGMKVVVLEKTERKDMPSIHLLALVRKDGIMEKLSQSLDPDINVMEELIWLNDVSFLCYFTGRVRTLYAVYVVSRGKDGGYVLNVFCDGFLHVGACTFVGKDGFLKITKEISTGEVPLLEIAIPSKGKDQTIK